MATRALIDAVKAALQQIIAGHNTYASSFNPGAVSIFPYRSQSDRLTSLQSKLDEIATRHNESAPLITAARDEWNAMVPDDPLPPPTIDTIANPVGWIGACTTMSAVGWAVDASNPTKKATLSVRIDGAEVAQVLANDPSPDVLSAGYGDGANRFHVSFSPPAAGLHQITIVVVGTNYTLLGCPVSITVAGTPPPSPGGPESPDESACAAGSGSITDRYGDEWSVSPSGVVLKNGATFVNTGGSTGAMQGCDGLRYSRHIVWGHSPSGWFQWFYTDATRSLGDWAFTNPPPYFNRPFASLGITPAATESPHKTRGSTCTDYKGRVWTLGAPASNGNFKVLRDGVETTAEAVEFTYMNHTVVLKDALGRYWDQEENILGTSFVLMENSPDPIAVEDGTVDYGPVDEGYRGTHTEAELAADPQFEFPNTINEWGINPGLYLPGLVNITTWPSFGNLGVLSSSGRPWSGPNMFNSTRSFAARTDDKWLHQALRVRANTAKNMHEQGIKLSELGANASSGGGNSISVRLWMRAPYHCLPNHFQIALYVYDYDQSGHGEFGDILMSRGFIKAEDFEGLSLYCKGNTFQADGTPNRDAEYIIRQRGRTILRITDRLNRQSPDIQFSNGSLQTYHGGMGAPCQDFNNPSGNAITIEMGPPKVGPVDPGFIRPSIVSPGPSPTWPAWRQGRTPLVAAPVAGSNYTTASGFGIPAVPAVQIEYSGYALDDRPGVLKLIYLAPGGHAINPWNPVFITDLFRDVPLNYIDEPGSPESLWGEADPISSSIHHYSDHKPGSKHYWHSAHFIPNRELAIRLGKDGHDAYRVLEHQWAPEGTRVGEPVGTGSADFPEYAPVLGGEGIGLIFPSARDRRNGDLWVINGGNGQHFIAAEWRWEAFLGSGWTYVGGTIDTKRNRFVALDINPVNGAPHIPYYDMAGRVYGNYGQLIPDPVHGMPAVYEYSGTTYDPDNDWLWHCAPNPADPSNPVNGSMYWSIDLTTLQVTFRGTGPTSMSGPNNRFQWAESVSGIVHVPFGREVWFIPTLATQP